jgi:2-polyprenyl-3-methyl-5-hydroxy-6-metoxy-1,4-benzoquinol methylase
MTPDSSSTRTGRLDPLDPRIPSWDLHRLIERDCPVCGSQTRAPRFVRPDSLTVHRCPDCAAWYVSPAPDENALTQFYQCYDASHRAAAPLKPSEALAAYESLNPLTDIRIAKLSSLMQLSGARVLDIGFGRGQFLYLMKQMGCKPTGLELDPTAISFGIALGLKELHLGDWSTLKADACFDIVSLNDVIEHPLRPRAALEAAYRLLSPRGLLLMWTPNGDSCAAEAQPTTFRVDLEHMQYLTVSTICRLAEELGFELAHVETLGLADAANLTSFRKSEALTRQLKRKIKCLIGPNLRKALKKIPGVSRPATNSNRLGNYHLFCILRKP